MCSLASDWCHSKPLDGPSKRWSAIHCAAASERRYCGETEVGDDGTIKEGKIDEGTPHACSRLLHFICYEVNRVLGQNQMQQRESPRSTKVGADKACMPSGGEHPSPSGVVYLTPSRFRKVLHAKAAVK